MDTKDMIRRLRTEKGLSQDELAEKLFVTRQAVSRWENGETTPNTETLKQLSRLFDVSINTLLGAPRQLVCQCCGMQFIALTPWNLKFLSDTKPQISTVFASSRGTDIASRYHLIIFYDNSTVAASKAGPSLGYDLCQIQIVIDFITSHAILPSFPVNVNC